MVEKLVNFKKLVFL